MAILLSSSLPLLASLVLTLVLAVSPAASTNAEVREQLLGGVVPADPNDKDVQKAVNFAVRSYNDRNNDLYLSKPIRVLSAEQQVVAGMNYFLKIELGRTTCTKAQSDLAGCPFNEQPDQQKKVTCDFQIYTVPWENKISMTSFHCHSP
ncbi:cystatin 10-like [Meriones unguiculatus]|uniref:cystatin 10-like n=1 Tax=Meriones unguiculatus TaxID=10047 RepID=UPI000B4F4C05|nr:cystatin 10-like [Meriones unguiculatus]XP_021484921.1 cystatin 10-like [Meriones unguiculatus]